MNPLLVVTATDTDAGKTWVCEQLIRHVRRQHREVCALKPFVSGYQAGDAEGDVARLLRAQGLDDADAVSFQRFALPASPDIAARAEGDALRPQAALQWCQQRLQGTDVGIIEGIGGLMVPLKAPMLLIDWFSRLPSAQYLLCVPVRLGCINHTLLSVEALQRRGLMPDYVLLNNRDGHSPAALAAMADSLRGFLPAPTQLLSCQANDTAWLAHLDLTS